MSFRSNLGQILAAKRPSEIRPFTLPRREAFHPSPVDWRNEVLYFFLPDRFSDGQENGRPMLGLDPTGAPLASAARPAGFRFDSWASSGSDRWQGGTLRGAKSKLDYLKALGITAVWVGPVFKQRGHLDTYHGYAIQDFLEVDPHFGTRQDLVDFVTAAHDQGIRVVLDIVFNHSGHNWDYRINDQDVIGPQYNPFPGFYQKGQFVDQSGALTPSIKSEDDGVFPAELQGDSNYTRAGMGSLSGDDLAKDVENRYSETKRTDFPGFFRDFNFDGSDTLGDIARCYKYWIALTDCDGFRLDTLKHVPEDVARNFCGTIKEFAANIGKQNYLLFGEVGGPQRNADAYLDALELNLNATLDIGELRPTLTDVAKGLRRPQDYFEMVADWNPVLGSHRNSGSRHVLILDDHDHVWGEKKRFSTDASTPHQVVAGIAVLLFTLGIPCLYYGDEQAFAGPEKALRDQFLPDFNRSINGNPEPDKYLRETMFGGDHPRKSGLTGLPTCGNKGVDTSLPGFGAFGTIGRHCFNTAHPAFVRIRHLIDTRGAFPALSYGRQYARPIRNFGAPFAPAAAGELITWARILDDEEVLCVINGNGNSNRGADVLVDATLNAAVGAGFRVVANSAQAAAQAVQRPYGGTHPIGQQLPVHHDAAGTTYVEIREIGPSEVIVLTNRPQLA